MKGIAIMATNSPKEPKIVLPPDIDPEVKKDITAPENDINVSMTVTREDGKLCVRCNYSNHDGVYKSFEKTFDNWKKLGEYGDKFLVIGDGDDEDEEE